VAGDVLLNDAAARVRPKGCCEKPKGDTVSGNDEALSEGQSFSAAEIDQQRAANVKAANRISSRDASPSGQAAAPFSRGVEPSLVSRFISNLTNVFDLQRLAKLPLVIPLRGVFVCGCASAPLGHGFGA
jgi:hypothetical protein